MGCANEVATDMHFTAWIVRLGPCVLRNVEGVTDGDAAGLGFYGLCGALASIRIDRSLFLRDNAMPTLAALDECLSVLVEISNHADAGLEDPTTHKEALLRIKRCCDEIDETIRGIAEGLPEDEEPPSGVLLN